MAVNQYESEAHRRLAAAQGSIEALLDKIEWQQENLDSAFRDKRPGAQPPAPDGNRNHHIDPRAVAKPAEYLFWAVQESSIAIRKEHKRKVIALLQDCLELHESAFDTDRTAALDEKREVLEATAEHAEKVEEYLDERET